MKILITSQLTIATLQRAARAISPIIGISLPGAPPWVGKRSILAGVLGAFGEGATVSISGPREYTNTCDRNDGRHTIDRQLVITDGRSTYRLNCLPIRRHGWASTRPDALKTLLTWVGSQRKRKAAPQDKLSRQKAKLDKQIAIEAKKLKRLQPPRPCNPVLPPDRNYQPNKPADLLLWRAMKDTRRGIGRIAVKHGLRNGQLTTKNGRIPAALYHDLVTLTMIAPTKYGEVPSTRYITKISEAEYMRQLWKWAKVPGQKPYASTAWETDPNNNKAERQQYCQAMRDYKAAQERLDWLTQQREALNTEPTT